MDGEKDAAHFVRILVYRLIQEGFDLQDIPEYVGYLCRKILPRPPANREESTIGSGLPEEIDSGLTVNSCGLSGPV